jgi:predicted nucleic acid-binding protein
VRRVFADTSYYVALLHTKDHHHEVARLVGSELDGEDARWFTTDAVLFEVLAFFSRGGPESRARAAELVDRLLASRAVDIVATSADFFAAAIDLYRRRPDKRYSLADCLGMVICGDRNIAEVLTTDGDFEAAGFTILLKP